METAEEYTSPAPSVLSVFRDLPAALALARALALDADVLLMDEPLSAIDALLRETLQDVLLDLHARRGHTQVLVTHSIEEAVYLGSRILVMTDRPARLWANPGVGSREYRDSAAFAHVCQQVRAALAASSEAEGQALANGQALPQAQVPTMAEELVAERPLSQGQEGEQ